MFLPFSAIAQAAHELWVDGSFAEDKIEPGDIDILLVMHRKNVSAATLTEVNHYSVAGNRAKLYNEKGLDLNWCVAEDKELGLDWFKSFFSNRPGEMTNYKKGIVRIQL